MKTKTTADKYKDMSYNGFERSHKIKGYQYYQYIKRNNEKDEQEQEQERDEDEEMNYL